VIFALPHTFFSTFFGGATISPKTYRSLSKTCFILILYLIYEGAFFITPFPTRLLAAPSLESHSQGLASFSPTPLGFALSRLWRTPALGDRIPSEKDAFRVIGQGEVGDKATQLILKHTGVRRMGFECPARTLIAEDILDEFFRTNGLGDGLREVAGRGFVTEGVQRIWLIQKKAKRESLNWFGGCFNYKRGM